VASSHRHTIFYAEDDPDDLQLVLDAFSNYPEVNIIHFKNGLQIVDHLKNMDPSEELPCLIILDINMPVMDGREALFRIKTLPGAKTVPIVMFTTSSNELDKLFAKKNGADFLTKPLRYDLVMNLAEEFSKRCRHLSG
jgi:CheY-like chemotaxis protein